MRLGNYFEGFLDGECATLGLTRDDLRAWRPPERKRGQRAPKPPAPSGPTGEKTPRARRSPGGRGRGGTPG